MANEDRRESAGKDTVDDAPPPARRQRKRKMVKEPPTKPKRITAAVSGDKAAVPVSGDARSKKSEKKAVSEKHAAKHATMIACNSTAMNLFSESEELRKLNEKIKELEAELKHQKELQHQSKV